MDNIPGVTILEKETKTTTIITGPFKLNIISFLLFLLSFLLLLSSIFMLNHFEDTGLIVAIALLIIPIGMFFCIAIGIFYSIPIEKRNYNTYLVKLDDSAPYKIITDNYRLTYHINDTYFFEEIIKS